MTHKTVCTATKYISSFTTTETKVPALFSSNCYVSLQYNAIFHMLCNCKENDMMLFNTDAFLQLKLQLDHNIYRTNTYLNS